LVEDAVLSPRNIEEIFIAFIGEGTPPSHSLLAALGEVTGQTEQELRNRYREMAQSVSGVRADPFQE
jgi:hypothetical protein